MAKSNGYTDDDLRLTNVTVVDTRTGKLDSGLDVILAEGKIRSIRAVGSSEENHYPRTIDCAGRYLVPGYLDMHVHSVEQHNPNQNQSVLLAFGVTGIRQMAGTPDLLRKRQLGELNFGNAAPELLAMPGTILTGGNASTPAEAVVEVQRQKMQGADFIKSISVSPKTYFASLAEARRLDLPYGGHISLGVDIVEASRKGVSFIEHLGGPFEMLLISCSKAEFLIRTMLKLRPPAPMKLSETDVNGLTGKLIVANPLLFLLNSNPKALDRSKFLIDTYSESKGRKVADVFAKNQTWHCPTLIRGETMRFFDLPQVADSPEAKYLPASIRKTYSEFSQEYAQKLTPAMRDTLKRHKELALGVTRMLDQAGVPMMAGSDYGGGWVIPGVSLHQEFDLLEEAGLSPLRILQMATLEGARFLGRESDLGTVEDGKQANLVLLDADPTVNAQNLHKVAAVIRGGNYYSREELEAMKRAVADQFAAA